MVVVKLQGGLGNQMFQYAFGRKLELKYNIPLYLDLSFLNRRDLGDNFTYRNYDLDIFDLDIKTLSVYPELFHYYITEPSLLYNGEISNIFNNISKQKSIYIDGYWQCDKYFYDIKDTIKSDFSFINTITSGKENELLSEIHWDFARQSAKSYLNFSHENKNLAILDSTNN